MVADGRIPGARKEKKIPKKNTDKYRAREGKNTRLGIVFLPGWIRKTTRGQLTGKDRDGGGAYGKVENAKGWGRFRGRHQDWGGKKKKNLTKCQSRQKWIQSKAKKKRQNKNSETGRHRTK